MTLVSVRPTTAPVTLPRAVALRSPRPRPGTPPRVTAGDDPDESDDDLADDEDLAAQPIPEEESAFEDFDDDFDDDFEEEENDPDWDHPEENEPPPPPAKGPGKRK